MSCDCVAHLPSSLHATCHKYLQPDCYYNSTQNGRRQTSDGIVRAGSSGKLQIAYCIQKNLQLATFNLQFNQIQQTVVSMRHLTVCVWVGACSEVKTLIKLTWQTTWWGTFMRKRNVANVDVAIQKDQRSLWTGHTQLWLKAFWSKTHKNNQKQQRQQMQLHSYTLAKCNEWSEVEWTKIKQGY